ncbi:MAG: hypothetical protein HY721_09280 [Planctomycetes bacterium]|nr:hypothetical protein [Planctomycetota bacterium]
MNPLAREVLDELRARPGAEGVVIGGGVALQHYCEFRDTVDLDAWWARSAGPEAKEGVHEALAAVAKRRGLELVVRAWGETQSYELKRGTKKVFSFQISRRTVELDPPLESAWGPVKIETFRDNLGAKMNALVDRGAPRDMLDVHEVCRRRLASVEECWETWTSKNPGARVEAARGRVLHHLRTLEARRPLDRIPAGGEREWARAVRTWIRETLCKGG